jgi:hypothetical protein
MDARAAELAFVAKLRELKLAQSPAEKIVKRPGSQLWLHAATNAQLAEQLCRNVYWYGINGNPAWDWGAGSGGNPTGEALARGTTTSTNCGGFNATARWIGHNVLGIPPGELTGEFTNANDTFITLAGTQGIDRAWQGNVRTLTQDFAQLGAYFFKGHSYCRCGANRLDASTNVMNFAQKTDLYWCELAITNTLVTLQNGRAFMVTQRYQPTAIPGPLPYCCVSYTSLRNFRHLLPIVAIGGQALTQGFVNGMPATTGNNWETMLLVSRDHVPTQFRQALNLP